MLGKSNVKVSDRFMAVFRGEVRVKHLATPRCGPRLLKYKFASDDRFGSKTLPY